MNAYNILQSGEKRRALSHSSCCLAHVDILLIGSVNPLRRFLIHIKNQFNTHKLKVKGVYEKLLKLLFLLRRWQASSYVLALPAFLGLELIIKVKERADESVVWSKRQGYAPPVSHVESIFHKLHVKRWLIIYPFVSFYPTITFSVSLER